jgi:P-type Ca2+ transporter type 2C
MLSLMIFDSAVMNLFESTIRDTGDEVLKIQCGPIGIMGSQMEAALLAFGLYVGGNFYQEGKVSNLVKVKL